MPFRKLTRPFPIFPGTVDLLIVDNLVGYPPSYRWALVESGSAEGMAVAPNYITRAQGNGTFTSDQWRDWKCANEDDDAYVLSCVTTNLHKLTPSPANYPI